MEINNKRLSVGETYRCLGAEGLDCCSGSNNVDLFSLVWNIGPTRLVYLFPV